LTLIQTEESSRIDPPPERSGQLPRNEKVRVITIELTEQEREVLVVMSESCVFNLRQEMSDTESIDYRAMLNARKEILERILEQLETEQETLARGGP